MSDSFSIKLESLHKALVSFKAALEVAPTELERDGTIQRFEYCYDLIWTVLKQYLQMLGITKGHSPRSVFAEALAEGLISDEDLWLQMIEKRNQSVHTYNQKLAESLYALLPDYYTAMQNLCLRMTAG